MADRGYNVLLIDLRDTGDSDIEDGYSAIGSCGGSVPLREPTPAR